MFHSITLPKLTTHSPSGRLQAVCALLHHSVAGTIIARTCPRLRPTPKYWSVIATLQHMSIQILISINKLPFRALMYCPWQSTVSSFPTLQPILDISKPFYFCQSDLWETTLYYFYLYSANYWGRAPFNTFYCWTVYFLLACSYPACIFLCCCCLSFLLIC